METVQMSQEDKSLKTSFAPVIRIQVVSPADRQLLVRPITMADGACRLLPSIHAT
jgi:hypothetical protein